MTSAPTPSRRVGVLALQGAVARHARILESLGVTVRTVRQPDDLDDLDGLVLPGGESTTMGMLLDTSELRRPLREVVAAGLPTLATCAGLILVASDVRDGRSDQKPLGLLDVDVRRNAYGRQLESFEGDVTIADEPTPLRAVFIRAPTVERVGDGVEVLGVLGDSPVLIRQGPLTAATFHPELTDDFRIHSGFVGGI